MNAPTTIDTNESARMHDRAIRFGSHLQYDAKGRVRLYTGYRYRCPRCRWKSRVMRHRVGARHRAEQHAQACACDGGA